jgi:hypothetical protein
MIQALTEANRGNNNKFSLPLLAPNRISRESLLLALGIANYSGKPSELTPVTILFPDMTLRIEEEGNPPTFNFTKAKEYLDSLRDLSFFLESIIVPYRIII